MALSHRCEVIANCVYVPIRDEHATGLEDVPAPDYKVTKIILSVELIQLLKNRLVIERGDV